MSWVLDDGPFGILARHFSEFWGWPPSTLHLVSDVAEKAAEDKSGRRLKLLAMTNGGETCVAVHEILADSPVADMVFNHLRPRESSATKNLGEHVSIAFCAMQDPEAMFVTCDKGAAYLALAELGPARVATPFDLWFWLAHEGLVTTAARNALCDTTARIDSASPSVPRRFLGA